ncbi:hypothetical protein QJS04_geneDACA022500 [Acorus gramineus]|uniref:Oxidation resistance protein 1 n=1 Tax=Acorus gramineus TaxID=55184 RepID=A0AAV9A184_ACOGR|nr:hypothetical protein QJS04_geneDACA020216 [Acorus gramineus]KAK1258263.1 hypothetical protein QJS04_geneDACA022500 [Acorus gramineus]
MGHTRESFRSKATGFVSDLTTVILNPISDEPSRPTKDEPGMKIQEPIEEDMDPGVPDGPDTSSFTAFVKSFLASSESSSQTNEEHSESPQTSETDLASENKHTVGRRSLISRGKQSLGRAFRKVTKIYRYRDDRVAEQKLDDHITNSDEDSNEASSQVILPDVSEPSLLLSENMRGKLYISLPALVQGRNWVLLYSTWRHGISLSTLYRRSTLLPGHCLLVVGDRRGAVFGGLVEAPLRPTNKRKYQGTNSTFVFTNLSSHPAICRPTGANRYFTLCSSDFLALGGGGHFALYLDGDLLNGSSSASETFGNSCLAHTQDFEVKEVELWGFVYASKYEETIDLCRTEAPGICRW